MASPSYQGKLELRTICGAMAKVEHKWFKIGIQLGISRSKLQEFKKDDDPFSAVIDYCLNGNVEPSSHLSWQLIVAMLSSEYIGEPGLADEISKNYCIPEEETPGSDPIKIAEKGIDKESDQKEKANDDSSSTVTSKASPSTQQEKSDQEIKKEVKRILNRNLKDILATYATYVDCLRVAVEEKKVSAEDLRSYLLSLPATSQSNEGETLTLLSDKEAQLNECKKVIDIFNFIKTKCASFLDYDIFECIQKRYGICDDEDVFKYPEYLRAYIEKHKISEFEKTNPLLKPKNGSKELILKYDIETTCRLAKLTDLKILIADVMEISSLALEIVDIEEGCVIVTFFIPASIADALFTPDTVFSPQQEDQLQAASVLWMKCNGRTYFFEERDHKEEAFQKLKEQLTCSICLGTYTDPKLLQCQHAYCQQCLMGLVQQDQQGQPTLTCPTCRQVTPVPASGVTGLQADFRANQLLEIVSKDTKVSTSAKHSSTSSEPASETIARYEITPPFCPDHEKALIDIFCGTCGEAICWKCSRDKHQGHDCESLNEAFIQCKENIPELLQATDYILTKLDACCDEISNQRSAIEEEIHSTITMDDRKTEFISQLHQLTQAKLKSLAAQRDQIETIQTRLDKHLGFMGDASYQRETPQTKSIIIKQVKEMTTALQNDLQEPKTKADLVFSKNLTKLYTENSPDVSKCIVTGVEGYALAQQESTATLEVFNYDGWPCKIPTSSISSKLVSEITYPIMKCTVERENNSQFKISYQPIIKGRHQLHIKVEGQHIRGSPFLVSVRSRVEDLGTKPILRFGGVDGPEGVAVNKKGQVVVVAERGEHCVAVFSPYGKKIRSFGRYGSALGQFHTPIDVTLDGKENILVADYNNNRIQKFTPQGEFLISVGTWGTGPFKFDLPCSITYNASNDRVYVVDNSPHIQVLDSNLRYVCSFGKESSGEGEFFHPRHIACDSNGNVYVTDWKNPGIHVFTAESKFLRTFGQNVKVPNGLAIDYNDRVYVSDRGVNRISIYTFEGQFVMSFGRERFSWPSGLAVDDCGVVYVCNYFNNRVEVY